MLKNKKKILAMVLILLFALIVRLAYISIYNDPVTSDSAQYDALAYNMLQGKGYILNKSLSTSNVSLYSLEAKPSAWRPPGYPIFLLLVYKVFNHNYNAVHIIQAFIGTLTTLIIYILGRKIWNHKIGIAGAIFYAIWPPFIVLTAQLLTETLNHFLVLTSIYIATLLVEKHTLKLYLWILLGLLLGYSVIVRPTYAFFSFFLIGLIVLLKTTKKRFLSEVNSKKFLSFALISLIISLTFAGAWAYRNNQEYGTYMVGSTMQGDGIYYGTIPFNKTLNSNTDPDDSVFVAIQTSNLSEFEKSQALTKKGLENIKNQPGEVLTNKISSLYYIWSMPYVARRLHDPTYTIFLESNTLLSKIMPSGGIILNMFFITYVLIHVLIVILFVLSLISTKWWKDNKKIIAYSLFFYLNALMFLAFGSDRYILAVIPIMFMGGTSFVIVYFKKLKSFIGKNF